MGMKKITVSAAVVFLCFWHGFCQTIDNAMAQEYLKQNGYNISNSQLQNLAKSRNGKPGTVSAIDSTKAKADSVLAAKKDSSMELSTYENLIRNKIVDPDSILKTLGIFGQDVFKNSKPTTFAPEDYLATPADYSVGSGDEINILLWGRINEEYRLKVDRDGRINIPHLGPIPVAGLPFSAMQKKYP
jgi:thiol-disulfide isomerase/thioredoxin